jgi:hypothetical protein
LSICLPIFFTTSTHFPPNSSTTSLTSCFVTSLSWRAVGAVCWAVVIRSKKLLVTCSKICYDCAICDSICFWARSISVLNLSSMSLCAFWLFSDFRLDGSKKWSTIVRCCSLLRNSRPPQWQKIIK